MDAIQYTPCKQEHLRLIEPQEGSWKNQLVYANQEMSEVFDNNFSLSAWANNRCIAAAGLIGLYPHYAIAWAFVSVKAGVHMLAIVRKVRSVLDAQAYRRIEMRVRYDFEKGHKFAILCGFKEEAHLMRKSGFYGEDETLYARVI